MKKNRILSLTLAALSLAALTACGSLSVSADISAAEVQRLIENHLGRSDFQILERSYDDGEYEIEFVLDGVKYEYEIDAATGRIREVDRDEHWDDDDRYDDDWDDRYDDDRYDDDWDDRYDDDRYDDDWDDRYDDDRYDDDWDDLYDDDWDDRYDD